MADGKVTYKVDYDVSDAKKELKGFSATLTSVSDKAGALGDKLTKSVTVPLVAVGGAAIAGFTKISAELDNIGKTAAGVNAAAEGLQVLQFAGRKAGIETDKMSDVLKKTQELTSRNAEAFVEAGITITDMNGEMLTSDKIFQNVISGLSGMSAEQRNATLLALGFTEELVAINKAMEDTAGFAANVETGLDNAISDESIQKFEEFNDRVEDMKAQLALIGVELAEQMLPHLSSLADWLEDGGMTAITDFIGKTAEFIEENWKLIAALAALGPALKVFNTLVTFGANISSLVTKLRSMTTALHGARAAAGVKTAATTATGAGASLGATMGMVVAPMAVGAYMGYKATERNKEKYGNNVSDAYNISDPNRFTDNNVYSGYGLSGGSATVGGSGGNVTVNKVEVNTTSDLSPENQGVLVNEIMTEVANELTIRGVVAP